MLLWLAGGPAAAGDTILSPSALIDRDLQPIGKLVHSARNKLERDVGGMGDSDATVTGYVATCCTVNVLRMRNRLHALGESASRLRTIYRDGGPDEGEPIAAEIGRHVREAREMLELFATLPDAMRARQALERIHSITLEINGDKKRLAGCCDDLALPVED